MTLSSTDIGPFSIVPRWVAEACKGQPLALAIYVWLADHADRRDAGFTIGREEIAEAMGVSRATSNRAIECLVDRGMIDVVPQRNGARQGWSRFHVRQAIPQRLTHEPLTSEPVQRLTGEPVFQEPQEITPSTRGSEEQERFDKFWQHYTRKVGKPHARRAFKSMLKKGHLTQARKGLLNWIGYWEANATPIDKIPYPATWLNDERYNDDPPPVPGWGLPATPATGKHKDAGRTFHATETPCYTVSDDGTRTNLDYCESCGK